MSEDDLTLHLFSNTCQWCGTLKHSTPRGEDSVKLCPRCDGGSMRQEKANREANEQGAA